MAEGQEGPVSWGQGSGQAAADPGLELGLGPPSQPCSPPVCNWVLAPPPCVS